MVVKSRTYTYLNNVQYSGPAIILIDTTHSPVFLEQTLPTETAVLFSKDITLCAAILNDETSC